MRPEIELYEVGLFDRATPVGSIEPDGEIHYTGYKRVPIAVLDGKSINEVQFPKVDEQDQVMVQFE